MNHRQQIHMAYNQQTNNQYNNLRSFHSSTTKTIFNGPIHGFIDHVTGEGPVIAYSEVTYVDRGHNFSKKTIDYEQKSLPVTTPPSRQFRNTSGNDRGDEAVLHGSALISPSIPIPIDRSVLEREFRQVSPEMQRYIKHLLHQYEESYTNNLENGQAEPSCDQR